MPVTIACALFALLQAPALQHVQSRLPASRVPSPYATATAQPAAAKQQQKQNKKKKQEDDSPYRTSVSLPITDFSQRAMAVTREPELQQFWKEQRVYERLVEVRCGRQ